MLYWNMDDASRTLILELLEQDALEESERQKGKQREGVLSDRELAVQSWSGQIHESATAIEDHKMALSIAKAVFDDGVALTLAAQEENRAFADRRLAYELAGLQPPEQDQPFKLADGAFSEEVTSHVDDQDESLLESQPNKRRCVAESSKTVAGHHDIVEMQLKCVACNEKHPASQMIPGQCAHVYCKDCMVHLVKDALADQSPFPPRCCRLPILPSSLRQHLGVELFKSYQEKELETNDPYRTYCSNADCAKYITPPQVEGYVGTCPDCQTRTCTLCKEPVHEGPCPEEDQEVMDLARQSGWQQCPRCHHLIELKTGCNHITCRCRYEFCYMCRMKWKTCRCANWDENRLLDRARMVAARNAQGPPAEQEVREVADRLREAPCQHLGGWDRVAADDIDSDSEESENGWDSEDWTSNDWTSEEGGYDDSDQDSDEHEGFECDICGDYLREFILECRDCQLQACVRCKRNRM